jgi:hypothetical protein
MDRRSYGAVVFSRSLVQIWQALLVVGKRRYLRALGALQTCLAQAVQQLLGFTHRAL